MKPLSEGQKIALERLKSFPIPQATPEETQDFLQRYGGNNIYMTIHGQKEQTTSGEEAGYPMSPDVTQDIIETSSKEEQPQ